MNSKVLKADEISEDLKDKVFVHKLVFVNEVEPEEMPKPRHVCVSKFDGQEWITKRQDTNEIVSKDSHEMFMFATLNSGKFTVVNNEEEIIKETVNEIK